MEIEENSQKTENGCENQQKNYEAEDGQGQGSSKSTTGGKNGEKMEYRMDMDEVMDRLGVPYKKITQKKNTYLFAMNTREKTEEIVLKIQALTKVTWSVKQTRKFEQSLKKEPKRPMTVFKRQYGCHMATRTRTKTRQLRKKKSRNIDCPAKLLVTIKTYLGPSKVKPKLATFDKDFPCMFEFRNHHNHLVDVVDVLTTRPLGDDIKDAIYNLLNKGHSCVSAYYTLYTLKVEEFGDDYKTKMADRHYFPRRNDIATIYKLHGFREKYQRFAELSLIVRNVEDLLSSYQKNNGTLYRMSVKDDTVVICLCTPLMQRAAQQNCEILFIDPSSDDFKDYKSYFILTQTAVGALPISCILSNKHDISAFTDGIKLFVEMLDIEPALVLTTGSIVTELVALNVFPNAKIVFSFYHALSSAWKCLYDTRHEIARSKKESYYQLFREVVFADNEEGLVVARQVLAVECAQPKFLAYIDQMYQNIQLWCLYYRQGTILHASKHVDFNEAELSFRLLREVPLERTRLFNISHIIDFVCSAFETYYKGRILEMVSDKKSQVLDEKYGRTGGSVPRMEHVGHEQYLFTKSVAEMPDEYYQVDMITLMCTCGLGTLGKHCEHVASLLADLNVFSPILTEDQKSAYYFIATGTARQENSLLLNRSEDIKNETLCSSPERVLEVEDAFPDLEATKSKWTSYCNKIVELMENDPAKFLPAVNAHLSNIESFCSSIPRLLKGLYAGFPYMGDKDDLPPLTIIKSTSSTNVSQNQNSSPQKKKSSLRKPLTAHSSEMTIATGFSSSSKSISALNCQPSLESHELYQDKNTKLSTCRPMNEKTLGSVPNCETLKFNIVPANLENVSGENSTEVFQIHVDQIRHGEVSVFDKKKGILIIPMDTGD